jgi:hypothetical protein
METDLTGTPQKKLKKIQGNIEQNSDSKIFYSVFPSIPRSTSWLWIYSKRNKIFNFCLDTNFPDLPLEIHARILSYLPFPQQLQLLRTCKYLLRFLSGAITELSLRFLSRRYTFFWMLFFKCLQIWIDFCSDSNFSFFRVKDEELVALISKFSSLQSLDLRSCYQITSSSTHQLTKLTSLRFLDLSYSGMKNKTLEFITNLSQLQTLKLARCQVTSSFLKYIRYSSDSQNSHKMDSSCLSLFFSFTHNSIFFRNISVQLVKLEHLNLSWPVGVISDSSVQVLSLLTNLKYLNLSWCEHISTYFYVIKSLRTSVYSLNYKNKDCIL